MTYGSKVKKLREEKELTLEEYAKETKIGKTTLFRIEAEQPKKMPKKQLEKIAKYHELPLEYFTTSQYDEFPPQIVKFIGKKEAMPYIMEAYYKYMADTIASQKKPKKNRK